MRLQVELTTRAMDDSVREVLRPGRGIMYGLLAENASSWGDRLHAEGMEPYGLVPLGHSMPRLPEAPARPDDPVERKRGVVEFSSPLTELAHALAAGLTSMTMLDWGGVALHVHRVVPVFPPLFSDGMAELITVTPVVVKGPPARDEEGRRLRKQRWLLPGETDWDTYFVRNLRRKAETLGLDPEVKLDSVLRVGKKRSLAVGRGTKIGADVSVRLSGAPPTLQALWSWGLGASNSAGFGSVTV